MTTHDGVRNFGFDPHVLGCMHARKKGKGPHAQTPFDAKLPPKRLRMKRNNRCVLKPPSVQPSCSSKNVGTEISIRFHRTRLSKQNSVAALHYAHVTRVRHISELSKFPHIFVGTFQLGSLLFESELCTKIKHNKRRWYPQQQKASLKWILITTFSLPLMYWLSVQPEASIVAKYKSILSKYNGILSKLKNILSEYKSTLSNYKSSLSE